MITAIGLEADFNEVIKHLINMDFQAAEAHNAAMLRIEDPQLRTQILAFAEDHLRHARELCAVAHELGLELPAAVQAQHHLASDKMLLMGIFGDKALMMALKTNIDDTMLAYERAVAHAHLHPLAQQAVKRGLADQRRHHAWINAMLKQL